MSFEAFKLQGFNRDNPFISSQITLNDTIFIFEVRWDFTFDFGYLVIRNENNEVIKGATALVNNLKIKLDQRILPGYLMFVHKDGEKYEPEIDIIEEEFIFYYANN